VPPRKIDKSVIRSLHYELRAVRFLRLAMNEPDLRERQRLQGLANHALGQAKLYRMVERRGCDKPVR